MFKIGDRVKLNNYYDKYAGFNGTIVRQLNNYLDIKLDDMHCILCLPHELIHIQKNKVLPLPLPG